LASKEMLAFFNLVPKIILFTDAIITYKMQDYLKYFPIKFKYISKYNNSLHDGLLLVYKSFI
jgi:hypothetical protein